MIAKKFRALPFIKLWIEPYWKRQILSEISINRVSALLDRPNNGMVENYTESEKGAIDDKKRELGKSGSVRIRRFLDNATRL